MQLIEKIIGNILPAREWVAARIFVGESGIGDGTEYRRNFGQVAQLAIGAHFAPTENFSCPAHRKAKQSLATIDLDNDSSSGFIEIKTRGSEEVVLDGLIELEFDTINDDARG